MTTRLSSNTGIARTPLPQPSNAQPTFDSKSAHRKPRDWMGCIDPSNFSQNGGRAKSGRFSQNGLEPCPNPEPSPPTHNPPLIPNPPFISPGSGGRVDQGNSSKTSTTSITILSELKVLGFRRLSVDGSSLVYFSQTDARQSPDTNQSCVCAGEFCRVRNNSVSCH